MKLKIEIILLIGTTLFLVVLEHLWLLFNEARNLYGWPFFIVTFIILPFLSGLIVGKFGNRSTVVAFSLVWIIILIAFELSAGDVRSGLIPPMLAFFLALFGGLLVCMPSILLGGMVGSKFLKKHNTKRQ